MERVEQVIEVMRDIEINFIELNKIMEEGNCTFGTIPANFDQLIQLQQLVMSVYKQVAKLP